MHKKPSFDAAREHGVARMRSRDGIFVNASLWNGTEWMGVDVRSCAFPNFAGQAIDGRNFVRLP